MRFDAYKAGQLLLVASEVISDAGIDISGFIGQDAGRAIGRQVGAWFVTGNASTQPQGIMTALSSGPGSVTTGGSLIGPTYEKLVDLAYSPADEYLNTGNAAWLIRQSTAAAMRKIRDGNGGTLGAAMWQPSVTAGLAGGQPDTFLGFPVYLDANVASMASNARIAAFGDWSAYWIRHVSDVVFERDTSYRFGEDQIAYRAKWRVDANLVDNNAFYSLVQNV